MTPTPEDMALAGDLYAQISAEVGKGGSAAQIALIANAMRDYYRCGQEEMRERAIEKAKLAIGKHYGYSGEMVAYDMLRALPLNPTPETKE